MGALETGADGTAMHALLATVGTGGDVFPYIGLGERLRSRGHRVTLAGPAEFRALAEGRGLAYHALVSEEESNALLNDPDFWHPLKGGRVAARWGALSSAGNTPCSPDWRPTRMRCWSLRRACSRPVSFRRKWRGRWRPSYCSRG